MRTYAAFIYAFLYFPIAIIVFYSFNEGRYAMDWQGFSLQWYATAWNNPFVMEALKNSMITAGATSVLSVIIGTAAALGIERVRNTVLRQVFDALIYIAIIVPSIVIGIATLIAAVTRVQSGQPVPGGPVERGVAAKADARFVDGDRLARAVQSCCGGLGGEGKACHAR